MLVLGMGSFVHKIENVFTDTKLYGRQNALNEASPSSNLFITLPVCLDYVPFQFSEFADILSAALSQHHLSGFEIAQLEFHHLN